jgi:hypothetical protein
MYDLRPQLRVRTLLLVVAVAALAFGGWLAWQRQHQAFLRREHYRTLIHYYEDSIARLEGMSTGEAQMAKMTRQSAQKYREASVSGVDAKSRQSAADEAERCDKMAEEFERMSAMRERMSAAFRKVMPGIRRTAERLAKVKDPEAEAELERLMREIP